MSEQPPFDPNNPPPPPDPAAPPQGPYPAAYPQGQYPPPYPPDPNAQGQYPQGQYPQQYPQPPYPQQYQPGQYPQQPYGYVPPPKTSGKAVTALVLALASFVLCSVFTSVPGFFVGRSAVKEIDRSGGALGGRGIATAAWIISLVNIVLSVLAIALFAVAIANSDCTKTSSDDSFSFVCE